MAVVSTGEPRTFGWWEDQYNTNADGKATSPKDHFTKKETNDTGFGTGLTQTTRPTDPITRNPATGEIEDMDAATMRQFIEIVYEYERYHVTEYPWAMLRNERGNIRDLCAFLGRIDHQVTSLITADRSRSYRRNKLRANADYLLFLRNNIGKFVEALENSVTPDGAPTYTPSPAYVSHANLILHTVLRLGGIEEVRYALTQVGPLLSPIVGVLNCAPFTALDVATAATSLQNELASMPSKLDVINMDKATYEAVLASLRQTIRDELPNITDPAAPGIPVKPVSTLIHYGWGLLCFIPGMIDNAIQHQYQISNNPVIIAGYKMDEASLVSNIIGTLTTILGHWEPMEYNYSCDPYDEDDVAAVGTELQTFIDSNPTWDDVRDFFTAEKMAEWSKVFNVGYMPLPFIPTAIQRTSLPGAPGSLWTPSGTAYPAASGP